MMHSFFSEKQSTQFLCRYIYRFLCVYYKMVLVFFKQDYANASIINVLKVLKILRNFHIMPETI